MILSVSNYIPSPAQMICNVGNNLKKISGITLPIIAIAAVPVAKAGPIAAAACFLACEAFLATIAPPAAVAYAPHCFAGCKIAMALPTP